jgi:hypothetical protein
MDALRCAMSNEQLAIGNRQSAIGNWQKSIKEKADCKRNDGGYHSNHKNHISNIEITVFHRQYFPDKIDILCHAFVQVFPVIHHFPDSPFVLVKFHLVKVAKEKQVHFPVVDLVFGKDPFRDLWPRRQYSKYNGYR